MIFTTKIELDGELYVIIKPLFDSSSIPTVRHYVPPYGDWQLVPEFSPLYTSVLEAYLLS